jgi:CRISPR/Cas system CSM-associated protein Csm3 (group 7 of RAMP superfamily)
MIYQAITLQIELTTALHVGTGKGGRIADSPIRRRSDGRIMIPGTAIAGALRTIATRLAPRLMGDKGICRALKKKQPRSRQPCRCAVCHLFGDVNPGEGGDEKTGGRASRLWVFDALPDNAQNYIRDNVGIDRVTGTAARLERVKFDAEVALAGAIFNLRLELDADVSEDDLTLLAAALAEWQAGRGGLGGRRSRGLGALKLNEARYHRHEMKTAKSVLNFLQSDTPWTLGEGDANWLTNQLVRLEPDRLVAVPDAKDILGVAQSWLTIEFSLTAEGPFLTHDTTAGGVTGFDHVSLLDSVPQKGQAARPLLPGSSLRGALRSQAERIARTLVTRQAAGADDFLQRCPACNPVESRREGYLTRCDTLLQDNGQGQAVKKRSELVEAENLCLSCWLFGNPRQGSRLIIEDASLQEGTEPVWKVVDFLAIDRFTGGALEGAKFDAAALWQPTFTVRLRLENPQKWEIGWLALVLRDLADGLIPVGFGAAKGFGRMKASNFKITGGAVKEADLPITLPAANVTQSGIYQVHQFSETDWLSTAAWQQEIITCGQDFTTKVLTFERDRKKLPPPASDSYFGRAQNLEQLYPLQEQR